MKPLYLDGNITIDDLKDAVFKNREVSLHQRHTRYFRHQNKLIAEMAKGERLVGIVEVQTCLLISALFIFSITFSTFASKSSFSFRYLVATAGSF